MARVEHYILFKKFEFNREYQGAAHFHDRLIGKNSPLVLAANNGNTDILKLIISTPRQDYLINCTTKFAIQTILDRNKNVALSDKDAYILQLFKSAVRK